MAINFRQIINEGYLYSGAFYRDSSHTNKLITDPDMLYRDKHNGGLYFYSGENYELVCKDSGKFDASNVVTSFGETTSDTKAASEKLTKTSLDAKQAALTGVAGYDATKTQVLKHVSGVLTWVNSQ